MALAAQARDSVHVHELPTGTVTFLFTDIEGSTKLLQQLGNRYAAVLEDHASLVRGGIAAAGGTEVSTEGDSFFAVFPWASKAVEAVVGIQRELTAHDWPEGVSVMVRMGLHTGDGVLGGDNYIGLDVHRAARIAAAGHGGQVLLSQATTSLIDHALGETIAIRHLGEHRLKDLADPEDLYELLIDGLPQEFPPLRSLDPVLHNLPVQLTSFLGRESEIAEVRRALNETRLVTLTGPGGTGKTRLAIETGAVLAGSVPDGVWYVTLAGITDPSLLATTVVESLGIRYSAGNPSDQLVQHFAPRDATLILDNFEQILPAAPMITQLLGDCPKLRVLVTSRAALKVSGEHEIPVPSLPSPNETIGLADSDEVGGYPAVALFVERARAVRPDFTLGDDAATVAEIVARLDGLPLAIELAAALVKLLPPRAILQRLGRRLDLLTGGPQDRPERQRSLRGAIAWSYELLDANSRALLEHMAVFVGGASYQMIEEVCVPDDTDNLLDSLRTLVDHSLVVQSDADGEARFSLLGSIRDFALEHLEESGRADEVRRRQTKAFRQLAAEADRGIRGPDEARWATIVRWDFDNLRSVVKRGIDEGDLDVVFGVAVDLIRYGVFRLRNEVADWAERGLVLPGAEVHPLYAPACGSAAWGAVLRGDMERAKEVAGWGVAAAPDLDDPARRFAVEVLADVALFEGRLDAARDHVEELRALAGDHWDRGYIHLIDSLVSTYSGDIDGALETALQSRRESDREGTPSLRAWSYYLEGEALMQRDPDRARVLFAEAMSLAGSVGSRFIFGVAQVSAASLEARHGDARQSLGSFRELVDQWHRSEHWAQLWITLRSVAELFVRLESFEVAGTLLCVLSGAESTLEAFGEDEQRMTGLAATIEERLPAEDVARLRARAQGMSADDVARLAISEIDRLSALGAGKVG